MLRTLCLAAALAWISLPTVAAAQASEAATPGQIRAAAEAFDLGRDAYQRDAFVGAAEQFERADSQATSSTALEYAMRAREKAGQLDRAATLAALGLARHPDDGNLTQLAAALLDGAKPELFELRVSCSEACELAVDEKIVHGAPALTRLVYLLEGRHSVRAGFRENRTLSRDIDASRNMHGSVRFAPLPLETTRPKLALSTASKMQFAPARQEPRTGGWSPALFWVGVGLTASAGAATIWSGIDTLNNPGEERVQSECDPGDESCAVYQEGLQNQRRTNILLGVTGGFGVGTLLLGLFATDWRAAERDATDATHKRRVGVDLWLAVGERSVVGAQGRF